MNDTPNALTAADFAVLRAPADAHERAVAAARALADAADDIYAKVAHFGSYAEAALLCGKVEQLSLELERALQVVQHGDLDVRSLVLEQVPSDYSWAGRFQMETSLAAYDHRLGARVKLNPAQRFSSDNPVNLMVKTLVAEGVLRKHQGNYSVRRAKPGEKSDAASQ